MLAYAFSDIACPNDSSSHLQWAILEGGQMLRKLSPSELPLIPKLASGPADQSVINWLKRNCVECLTKGKDLPLEMELLRFIAGSAKLFYGGKRIVCDFFSKNTFVYKVFRREDNRWFLSGYIKEKDKSFPLSECNAIRAGLPPCYIRQGQLKFFDSDIPWRHLKALFSTPEIFIDDEWREYLLTLKGEACLEVTDAAFYTADDPLPFVVLADRTGAFINLKMDYGNGKVITYLRGHPLLASQSFRKLAVEKQWEADLLETDFTWKPTGNSQYYCPLDKVAKSLSFLLELGWQAFDMRGNRIALCKGWEWEAKERGAFIDIKAKLRYENYQANLKEAIGCFNRREKFISLGEGAVGLLPSNFEASGIDSIALEGEWTADDSLSLVKTKVGLLSDLLTQEISFQLPENLVSLCKSNKDTSLLQEIPLPDTFYGQLRHYQQIGLNWLSFLYNNSLHGLLADDMGLGKTVQVIAFLSSLQPSSPSLIVAPTSLIHNWKSEISRFWPTAKICIHHGPQRDAKNWESADVVLTTYATLRLDHLLFQKQPFHCIILDEAHSIKNAYTQTAQAAFGLQAQFKLSLTGTPVENSLKELWSQFQFLMPGLLGSLESFESAIESGTVDSRFLARVRRQVKPFMLRRTKKEVAPELPEKIEQTVWVEMEPQQRQFYDSFLAGVRKNLLGKVQLEGVAKHRLEILEVLLRLRQICCDPKLVAAQQEEAFQTPSAKMDSILEDLETLAQEGAKVLIYSQFTSLLSLLRSQMEVLDYKYLYLDGQTRDRAEVVNKFQTDSSYPFFLISLKAGGVGLNLTAADYVLLLDPWWNEAAEQQAIDRAHRIGRLEPVIAKRYIVLDSIEEKMMKIKEQKMRLAADLFESQNVENSITAEDFEWLLS